MKQEPFSRLIGCKSTREMSELLEANPDLKGAYEDLPDDAEAIGQFDDVRAELWIAVCQRREWRKLCPDREREQLIPLWIDRAKALGDECDRKLRELAKYPGKIMMGDNPDGTKPRDIGQKIDREHFRRAAKALIVAYFLDNPGRPHGPLSFRLCFNKFIVDKDLAKCERILEEWYDKGPWLHGVAFHGWKEPVNPIRELETLIGERKNNSGF